MKELIVLGSTGSIGKNVLRLAGLFPDKFRIVGIAAGSNINALLEQIKQVKPEIVAVSSEKAGMELKKKAGKVRVIYGPESLSEIAAWGNADTVINSVVGEVGLKPTLSALEAGRHVLLANKETLVAGGHLVMPLAKKKKLQIIPIDSEHSALHQCLQGHCMNEVHRLVLTASGGPFRKLGRKKFREITLEQALKHPKWKMGRKITIDSATLMNKGLEVIEAHWLFGIDYSSLGVVVHPQSIIHSMVQFIDGSFIAQLGVTDMMIPISYAMNFPKRLPLSSEYHMNVYDMEDLQFYRPDTKKFPCLELAYEAGKKGGSLPVVLNSANEEAVSLFLGKKIRFMDIPVMIEKAMKKIPYVSDPNLEEVHEISYEARAFIKAEAQGSKK